MALNIKPQFTDGQYVFGGSQTAAPLPLGGVIRGTLDLRTVVSALAWVRLGLISGAVPANALNFSFRPQWNTGTAPGAGPHQMVAGSWLPAGTLGQTTCNASSAAAQDILAVASSSNFTGQTTTPADTICICPPELAPVYAAQNDGGAWTAYTTEIGNVGANDVVLYPATPVANDYFMWKFGSAPATQMRNVFGTAGVSVVMATLLEYPTAQDVWAPLTQYIICDTSRLTFGDPTTTMQPSTIVIPSKYTAWLKPPDWVSTTDNGQAGYALRCRVTGYTSKTTFPVISQGFTQNLEPVAATTALEFARVGVPGTGKLQLDDNLQYTHSGSAGGASIVTDNAMCYGPVFLQGGTKYRFVCDYAAQATGGPAVCEVMYQTYDYDVAG
jgi:hypothetical protein